MPIVTTQPATARRAGVALAAAAALAVAGFTALGSVFEYPQILHRPVGEILALFRDHQLAVTAWFGVLVLGAATLAPAALWLGRLVGGRLGTAVTAVGFAAGIVQVAGLQRWLTLVPGFSHDALDPARHDAAVASFSFWHTVLGQVVGETIGYALTAVFTILVAHGLRRIGLPAWLASAGYAAAALIATGVAIPIAPILTVTNFVGYVVWCLWLLAMSVILLRARSATADRHVSVTVGSAGR